MKMIFQTQVQFPGAALKNLEDLMRNMTAAARKAAGKYHTLHSEEGVERVAMSCLTTDETLNGAKSQELPTKLKTVNSR